MLKPEELKLIFQNHGFYDFKWINPSDIVVSNWVRMKCMYGCPNYGNIASCPPNTFSVSECKEFFKEYEKIAIFHFEKHLKDPEERHEWGKELNKRLLKLEREIFLTGYVKAFILIMDNCNLCEECSKERKDCKNPKLSRPTPEGMSVDVYQTVKKIGYPINVLKDYTDKMNRYAFLLVE